MNMSALYKMNKCILKRNIFPPTISLAMISLIGLMNYIMFIIFMKLYGNFVCNCWIVFKTKNSILPYYFTNWLNELYYVYHFYETI